MVTRTAISRHHWMLAFVFAAAIHLALFAMILEPPSTGAAGFGEGGLEIALGPGGGTPGVVGAAEASDILEATAVDSLQAAEALETDFEASQPETADLKSEEVLPEELPSEVAELPEASLEPLATEAPLTEQLTEVTAEAEAAETQPLETEALEASEPEVAETREQEERVARPQTAPPRKPHRAPRRQQLAARPAPPPLPSAPAPSPSSVPPATSKSPATSAEIGNNAQAGEANGRESGRGTARSAGGNPGAERDYYAQLLAWLERHKEYPREARARRRQGTALLWVEIDRQGRVLSYAIRESAGDAALDGAVEKMIRRAQPLPALPAEMPQQRLSFVVPVQFQLR